MTSAQRLLKKFYFSCVQLLITFLFPFYFSQSFATKNVSDILFANSSGFQELPFNGGQVDPSLVWPCSAWPEDQSVT